MHVMRLKIGSKKHILDGGLAITIGNFDGVHRGHQKLIETTKHQNLASAVMTFDPHPNCVIKSKFEYYFLTPLERRIELIRKINPDYLFIVKFDLYAAASSKDDFIKWLLDMNVKCVVCGPDFHFGYKAQGSIEDLKKYFKVVVIDEENDLKERISSTCIKKLLSDGLIKEANYALGRPYFIEGIVVHGSEIGRKIGFPTANIDIFGNLAPKKGVYAVKIRDGKKIYFGMANLGNNPTINYTINSRLEINIFNFEGDLYGKNLVIYFLDFIREEKKFNSEEELVNEINNNREQILLMIKNGLIK